MTSSDSEERSSTRKRTRASNDNDEGPVGRGKKARGRPRVDTQDATAADRRRTQIRLAQRAYRQRKETTISSLKEQNGRLQSIIEQMNQAFVQLNDSAVQSGLLHLNTALAQQCKVATETFSTLTKTAKDTQYLCEEEQAEVAEPALGDQGVQNDDRPEPEMNHIGWGYSAVVYPNEDTLQMKKPSARVQTETYFDQFSGTFDQSETSESLTRQRQFTVGEVLDPRRPSSVATSQSGQTHQLPFGYVDILSGRQTPYPQSNPRVLPVHIPTPDMTHHINKFPTTAAVLPSISTMTLPLAKTYSHNESTFARRLMRVAVEAALQLLNHAHAQPKALNRVFRLSLRYLTPDQIRTNLKNMLAHDRYEDLDWWDAPFLHLGGAGTHYPRRDAHGHIIHRQYNWTEKLGPHHPKTAFLQCINDGRYQELDDMDLSGLEGEWFDSYDIEGYLDDKYACRIEPNVQFAQCLIEDQDNNDFEHLPGQPAMSYWSHSLATPSLTPPNLTPPSLTHSSSADSSESTTPPANTFDNLNHDSHLSLDINFGLPSASVLPRALPIAPNFDISFDQTLGLDLAPNFDFGFNAASNMNLRLDMMGESMEPPPGKLPKKKKTAWIDVNQFIGMLITKGVCLSRAPGFQKDSVDLAVQGAIVMVQ